MDFPAAVAVLTVAAQAVIGNSILDLGLNFMDTEQKVEKLGKRVKTVEEAVLLLTSLIENHGDLIYDFVKENENFNEKINALVDSQIRREDDNRKSDEKINALIDAQIRSEDESKKSDAKLNALFDAQIRSGDESRKSDAKLSALVDAQIRSDEERNELRNGLNILIEAQAKTETKLQRLTDLVEAAHSRIDRLEK